MMAGLAIENREPIILDPEHNSYDGPRGLFRIVVDRFNHNSLPAWHIEDKYGEISRNLGGSECKSLDAIVGRVSRFAFEDAIKQLRWTNPRHVNKLMQENQHLKEELSQLKSISVK
jgi:hypothetical protein